VFLRKAVVKNTGDTPREIRVFFGQEFEIYESRRGDTAYFDPINNTITHYNGKRVFLINGRVNNRSFDDYTTGIFNIEGHQGSYMAVKDGTLPKNPIEHGPTDSVISFHLSLDPEEEKTIYYWITVGKSIKEVQKLNEYVVEKSPEYMIHTTRDFWRAWVTRHKFEFEQLNDRAISLFRKSLFIIRAHTDNGGSILASGDSKMMMFGKDSYGYTWPRDGALCAYALDLAGNTRISRKYFQFCNDTITDEGYLMHKYRPDKSLGSSWHPWVRNGKVSLPIQEDETALVIHSLWNHYELSKDLEFIESVYNSLIKRAAEFMIEYRDENTGLPKPSYDPWEEKYGISTYTAATVVAGLLAASKFAQLLGKSNSSRRYKQAANEIRDAIEVHLWDEEQSLFYKMINTENERVIDKTLDISSFYGLVSLDIFDVNDPKIERFAQTIKKRLLNKMSLGGYARYEGDKYFRIKNDEDVPGNPWIITTLWMAQYAIKKATDGKELEKARDLIDWATKRALPSGILAEQFNPYNGEPISAMPLTWSHAEFVTTIIKYLDKLEKLGMCIDCNPVNRG
ncbi:MAG: glycoside hydrolase family 15 protein, partial [Candidatus Pacebacteria bacterium]|nr:glycoside hydrolase family 15 protein [Candidatus Paceibacterota bacterium]